MSERPFPSPVAGPRASLARASLAVRAGLCLAIGGAAAASAPGAEPLFDAGAASGLDFVHFNGMSGEYYLPEMMAPGAALFDCDGDGDLDVFLPQGRMLGPGKTLADARFPPPPGAPPGDRLFRNDLAVDGDGRRRLRFTDVSGPSGISGGEGYAMGAATGDYDGDGRVDLYVTALGPDRLLRNRGDGTFEDVTARAGLGDPRWSVSAAFVDYDRDGWLDLYVANYLEQDLARHRPCRSPASALDYCHPLAFAPESDRLYRSRGDGTFEDVSARAGIGGVAAPGLGVLAGDFNGDGWPDLYVANDATPNFLWVNQGDGTFRDEAVLAGVAVSQAGAPQASMGIAAGDFDADGDEDLVVTHLTGEANALYVNDSRGWFEDRGIALGLAGPSLPYTSFGVGWIDLENDGALDLFVANGAVTILRALSEANDPYPLHQPSQVFANQGGRFVEVLPAGRPFGPSEVSRGAAFGDLDNDGDTDVLVGNNNGPARLLLSPAEGAGHWIGLRVLDRAGRDALLARVEVTTRDGPPRWRTVRTDGSYGSASDPRVLVGLGAATAVPEVRVHWPDGTVEAWRGLPADRYATLRRGTGTPVPRAGIGP
jgi:hypothetical protein